MRKAGRALEIDGKRRIWAVLKSICVRSEGENEVVAVAGWGGSGRVYSVREEDIASGHPASPAAAELF